jgi:hypothetical protein
VLSLVQEIGGIVMTKVKKDRAALEAMVLAELRQVPRCEDARGVTVIGWTTRALKLPGMSATSTQASLANKAAMKP